MKCSSYKLHLVEAGQCKEDEEEAIEPKKLFIKIAYCKSNYFSVP